MKIHYKYLLLIVWMGFIFFLSAEGADGSQARSGVLVGVLKESLSTDLTDSFLSFLTRKAAHIVAYFVLGLIIYSIIKTYKLTIKRTIVLSIILALLYAIFDEVHQLFVPGRSGEIRDVLIDTVAAGAGVGACNLYYRIRNNRKNNKYRV